MSLLKEKMINDLLEKQKVIDLNFKTTEEKSTKNRNLRARKEGKGNGNDPNKKKKLPVLNINFSLKQDEIVEDLSTISKTKIKI